MEKYEIENLLSNLKYYLESKGIQTDRMFRCINPEHQDNDPSMKYFDDNKVYCFGCGKSYNLIECISILENMDKKEAFKYAIQCYGNFISSKRVEKPITKKENNKSYTKAYSVWRNNYQNSESAKNYMKSRGIDEKTIERFKIGFNTFDFGDFKFNAIIIPISQTFFSARTIDKDYKFKYYKPKGKNIELFNCEALTNDCPYCVIAEGEFDCLSFETIGINSIALCSANNVKSFIEMKKPLNKTFIIALDNDKIGKENSDKLINYFNANNIDYKVFNNSGYKDANEALVKDRERFENDIKLLCNNLISNTMQTTMQSKKDYAEM